MSRSRFPSRLALLLLVAVALHTSACFEFAPTYPENVMCGAGGECPPGQSCDQASNRCVAKDAGPADAGPDRPLVEIAPIADLAGCGVIEYTLTDPLSRRVNLLFTYSRGGGADAVRMTQAPSEPGEAGVLGVTSSPTGLVHRFHWNTTADIGAGDSDGSIALYATVPGQPAAVFHAQAHVRNGSHPVPACDRDLGGLRGSDAGGGNVSVGDLNSDGKPDAVVVGSSSVAIYLGLGNGDFAPGRFVSAPNSAGFGAVADIDGDHDDDIIVGGAFGLAVLVQDPAAPDGLQPIRTISDSSFFRGALAVGDIDNDGVVDLVAGGLDGLEVFRGSSLTPGTPVSGEPVFGVSSATAVALTDLDADGVLELITLHNQFLDLFRQDPHVPGVFLGGDHIALGVRHPDKLIVGDVTRDGLPDVVAVGDGVFVFAQQPGFPHGQLKLLSDADAFAVDDSFSVRGVLDGAAVWDSSSAGSPLLLSTSDDLLAFRPSPDALPLFDGPPARAGVGGALALADFDGDFIEDLAIMELYSIYVARSRVRNGGLGELLDPPGAHLDRGDVTALAVGNFSGGAGGDVAIGYAGDVAAGTVVLYSRKAGGEFVHSFDLPFGPKEMVTADLNQDGFEDFAIIEGVNVRVLRQFNGLWSGEPLIVLGSFRPQALAVADLDADGRLDLIVGNDSSVSWLRNLTAMQFADPQPLLAQGAESILVKKHGSTASLDVIAVSGRTTTVFNGTPASGFAATATFSRAARTHGRPRLADVDLDGDLDLLLPTGGDVVRLDGSPSGDFVQGDNLTVEDPFSSVSAKDVGFADVNGDTLPDVVVTGENLLRVYFQTPGSPGTFTRHEDLMSPGGAVLQLADFDGHGRTGIVFNHHEHVILLRGAD